MANQKELVFTLKFRTEDDQILEKSATTLKDIKKSISDLEDELQNTDLGSEQWKELNQNLEESKDALNQAEQASMSLGDKLGAIPGPIGQVVQGVKGLGTAFKALIANPIILVLTGIVAALGALYKAFASTKEGGEQLRQVSAALGAVMDVFRDILVKVAKVLIDIFTNPVESLKNFGKLLQENLINRFTGMLEKFL
jgi:ABC-type transporter Mla subunit MlaD